MTFKSALVGLLLISISFAANAFGTVSPKTQTFWCLDGNIPSNGKYCSVDNGKGAYVEKFFDIYGSGLGVPLTATGVWGGIEIVGTTYVAGGAYCIQDGPDYQRCGGLDTYMMVNGVSQPAGGLVTYAIRRVQQGCPENSLVSPIDPSKCQCNRNYHPNGDACVPYNTTYSDAPLSCSANPPFGQPILPLSGSKRHSVELGSWLGQGVSLKYDTRFASQSEGNARLLEVASRIDYIPPFWGITLFKALNIQRDYLHAEAGLRIQAIRGPGAMVSFWPAAELNKFVSAADVNDQLKRDGPVWLYVDAATGATERYDYYGTLQRINYPDGRVLNYLYSDQNTLPSVAPKANLPISITDQLGRALSISYSTVGGRAMISKISLTSNEGISFEYDEKGNIQVVRWLGSASLSRKYLYENSAYPWAVTGVEDESGALWATFGYDAQGRANETQLSGGVNRYFAEWATPPAIQVTEDISQSRIDSYNYSWVPPQGTTVNMPNGEVASVAASVVLGNSRVTGQSQPAGSGCAASTSSQDFDANANVAWKEDFNGYRVCYAHDLNRNLETSRVEGLVAGSSCSEVLASAATLPTGSRKVTTAWHPGWRKAAKTAEPRRITTYVYNGRPDPTNGDAIASCAPSTATLPDGKPIVVLCKQVEQATTDADGSQGFAAAMDANVSKRVQQWTYTSHGQVLTYQDPLGNTTTYTYYQDTTADHTIGDLSTVTNALEQVVSYVKYNAAGQWLEMVDPNTITTTRTFDQRQKLTSVSTAGATTSYDYWPTGLLKRITQPDESFMAFGYDGAHRLTDISDDLGNKITYELDDSGNRTAESVKDPAGTLKRSLSRSFDALNRVKQTSGAAQ